MIGLAYLQYYQIAIINWNRLQQMSEGAITTVSNVTILILGISGSISVDSSHAAVSASLLTMTNFGIPLTGSMSSGFTRIY